MVMVISFHGVVFHSHKFIYADANSSTIFIHLEGLPAGRPFVTLSVKNSKQAEEWLEELSVIMNNHYRSEIALKKK